MNQQAPPLAAAPAGSRAGRAIARLSAGKLPLVPALLVVAILLPEDLSVGAGGLLLTMPRLLLVVTFPLIAARVATRMFRRGFNPSLSDYAILPLSAWMFLSVAMTEGVQRAVVGSSALVLEFTGAYFAARVLTEQPGSAVALARFTAWAIALFALLGPLDNLTGRHITHDIAGMLAHNTLPWGLDYRRGLLRAQGAQGHPILLGTVCCAGIVLSIMVLRGAQRAMAVFCTLLGLFSTLSSAPIMATVMGIGLLGYRQITPQMDARWRILGAIMAMLGVALFTVESSPFGWLISHFTLDPETGYYRLLIWQVAGPLVLQSPLFGIGLDDWARASWMPNTVDALWLRTAMMFGIVGSLLLATVVIGACSRRIDSRRVAGLTAEERSLGLALSVITFLFVYVGFTVHFWGCTWLLLGLLAGLRARVGALTVKRRAPLRNGAPSPVKGAPDRGAAPRRATSRRIVPEDGMGYTNPP